MPTQCPRILLVQVSILSELIAVVLAALAMGVEGHSSKVLLGEGSTKGIAAEQARTTFSQPLLP